VVLGTGPWCSCRSGANETEDTTASCSATPRAPAGVVARLTKEFSPVPWDKSVRELPAAIAIHKES
jgi:hypothetical protein